MSMTLKRYCVMQVDSHSSEIFTKGTYAMSNTKDTKPAAAPELDKKLFVEKRPEGNSERARELNPVGALAWWIEFSLPKIIKARQKRLA